MGTTQEITSMEMVFMLLLLIIPSTWKSDPYRIALVLITQVTTRDNSIFKNLFVGDVIGF